MMTIPTWDAYVVMNDFDHSEVVLASRPPCHFHLFEKRSSKENRELISVWIPPMEEAPMASCKQPVNLLGSYGNGSSAAFEPKAVSKNRNMFAYKMLNNNDQQLHLIERCKPAPDTKRCDPRSLPLHIQHWSRINTMHYAFLKTFAGDSLTWK